MSHTVFISNLPRTITSSDLEDMFSLVGNVQKAEVHVDAVSGLSQGFGTVEMSGVEEAQDCVTHFNGQRSEGLTLIVRAKNSLAPAAIPPESLRKSLKKIARRSIRQSKRTKV